MQRRFQYALTAGVLSSGAPAGLLGIRLVQAAVNGKDEDVVRRELIVDRPAYLYVGGATALIFAAFGYALGKQADRLANLSETDSLTRLYNARGFASRLLNETKRARRYRDALSLLFLDVDGLKKINDRYGHRAGSEALRQIAHIIRSELRETDTAARWGGDEFTIVAPKTNRSAAISLAERIRGRIAERTAAWPLTASIGVATLTADQPFSRRDSVGLMRSADAAMYDAKRRGKNAVVAAKYEGLQALDSSLAGSPKPEARGPKPTNTT
jgi:diguanylate cyclase (GGDEF)-like protein